MGGVRLSGRRARSQVARGSAFGVLLALYVLLPGAWAYAMRSDASLFEQRLPVTTNVTAPEAVSRISHWRAFVKRTQHLSDAGKITAVNSYFNALHFVEDTTLWRKQDYWATPMQVVAAAAGDCEDIAIAKYFTLKAAGLSSQHLRITYVWNHDTRSGMPDPHMVLVYTSSSHSDPVVLDILTDGIQPLAKRPGLEPVYSLNSEGLWLEGGRARAIAAGSPAQLPQWRQLIQAMKDDAMLLRRIPGL